MVGLVFGGGIRGTTMWQIEPEHAPKGQMKKYQKKHEREFTSCFANLDRLLGLLNEDAPFGQIHVNYLRQEGDGIWRIGQTGVAHARETRLYIYPDEATKTVYVLGIGDKDTQPGNLKDARDLIKHIRDTKGVNNEPKSEQRG